MQDVPSMLESWKEKQKLSIYEEVHGNPRVAPFHPYELPDNDKTLEALSKELKAKWKNDP
jgi:hypothetical protein